MKIKEEEKGRGCFGFFFLNKEVVLYCHFVTHEPSLTIKNICRQSVGSAQAIVNVPASHMAGQQHAEHYFRVPRQSASGR